MIDTERLFEIFYDCLFLESEVGTNTGLPTIPFLETEGVLQNFAFHEARYRSHETEIVGMLNELQDTLFGPGGNTFLAMPTDKNGDQWGEHQHCEILLALASAGGYAKFLFDRDQWPNLLGGMPFVQFSRTPFNHNETIQ